MSKLIGYSISLFMSFCVWFQILLPAMSEPYANSINNYYILYNSIETVGLLFMSLAWLVMFVGNVAVTNDKDCMGDDKEKLIKSLREGSEKILESRSKIFYQFSRIVWTISGLAAFVFLNEYYLGFVVVLNLIAINGLLGSMSKMLEKLADNIETA